MAAEVTVAHRAWSALLAPAFVRSEPRLTFVEFVQGMVMGMPTRNCWTIAEAPGHRDPSGLQRFLARAGWDRDGARDVFAAWALAGLEDVDGVVVVDETGDAKSSADAVGAAHQHSGALGGVGLCQVAVHMSLATSRGHALVDRALYPPAGWAADDERRELAGVPDETAFATKPELAAVMFARLRRLDCRARWATGDEIYGGRDLRRCLRGLGAGTAAAPSWSPSPSPKSCGGRSRPSCPHRPAHSSTSCTGPPGASTTNTGPAKPNSAGTTPPPNSRHDPTNIYSCRDCGSTGDVEVHHIRALRSRAFRVAAVRLGARHARPAPQDPCGLRQLP